LEVEHFSDCVLNNKKPHLSLNDAKSNCQLIVATLESIKTQQVVKVI